MISRKGYSDYENGLTYSPARGFYSQATGQRTQSSAPGTLGGYASGAIFDDEDDNMGGMTNAASYGAGLGMAYHKGKGELLGMEQFQPGSKARQEVSGMISALPYVGQAKMLQEAITGNDEVAGCEIGNGQRVLNGALAALPIAGAALEKAGAAGLKARALRRGEAVRITRYGSEAEAIATTEAKGLVPRPGHELQPKWVAGPGSNVDPRTLGKRENYTHVMEFVLRKAELEQFLKKAGIGTKSNEPGCFSVPRELIEEFNKLVVQVRIKAR
jgi:hypothetical protein